MCCNLCDIHKNPLNLALHIFALVVLIMGIVMWSWVIVVVAIAVALIGHLIQIISKKPVIVKGKKKR